MDLDNSHQEKSRSSDESAQEHARRRSNFSLSFALRSPRNRASVLNIDTPEPVCQDKAHYSVYNPQESRHSPSTERHHEFQNSSSDFHKQAHWVQDLQKRSIHKVRSGILALRGGLQRLSSRNDSDIDDTSSMLERPHRHDNGKKRGYGFQGVSDASTQEDVNFGIGLYRMHSPWPPGSCEGSREPGSNQSIRGTSSLALTNVSTPEAQVSCEPSHSPESSLFPLMDVSRVSCEPSDSPESSLFPPMDVSPVSCEPLHSPESLLSHHVDVSSDDPPPYSVSYDRPFADHLAETDTDTDTDAEKSIDKHVAEHLDRSDASDWETIASGKESASPMNEHVPRTCGTFDTDNTPQQQPVQETDLDMPSATRWCGSSLPRKMITKSDSSISEQETTSSSTGSFKLPDPDAPSSCDSGKSAHPIAEIRESEALVTQEHLQIHREIKSVKTAISSVSTSRKCSANVRIAFPGLYHTLLEQWTREPDNHLMVNTAGIENNPLPSQVSSNTAAPEQLDPQCHIYHELPRNYHNYNRELAINTSGGHRPVGSSEVLSSGEHSLTAHEDIWVQAGRSSHFRAANSTRSSSTAHAHPSAEMPAPETRHSFGLHITQRDDSRVRAMPNEPSQQAVPQAFTQRAPTDNQYASLSSLVTGDPLGSPFDQSECSSIWTNASSISPGTTSRTSMSTVPWSPIDSPIDEEVLFSNNIWRDEYYMTDGKTNSHYHDRGDQPVKRFWRQRVVDDGNIHRGPGLDRTPSSRPHVSELMTPTTFPCPPQPNRPNMEMRTFEPPGDNTPENSTRARRLG